MGLSGSWGFGDVGLGASEFGVPGFCRDDRPCEKGTPGSNTGACLIGLRGLGF